MHSTQNIDSVSINSELGLASRIKIAELAERCVSCGKMHQLNDLSWIEDKQWLCDCCLGLRGYRVGKKEEG